MPYIWVEKIEDIQIVSDKIASVLEIIKGKFPITFKRKLEIKIEESEPNKVSLTNFIVKV